MCDEPYMIIGLGNAYDFVIKNVNEPETYGTFQGDKKSIKKFIEKVNSIVKENEQLKEQINELQEFKDNYDKNMELIHNSDYVQDFLNGNL